jgi:hypothetical protein
MGKCCSKPSRVTEAPLEDRNDERKEREWDGTEHDGKRRSEEMREPCRRQPRDFEEIVDAKHLKYMEAYEGKEQGVRERFWGIGLENESYLEWSVRWGADAFRSLLPKRERYSVDYYKSFAPSPLENVLEIVRTMPHMTYPVWMNAHTFQKMDTMLQHKTLYDITGTPNPAFTESIHDRLMRECEVYREAYDRSVVFDGDTIEFITQDYYCTTTTRIVDELRDLKTRWIGAVGPWLDGVATSCGWKLPLDVEGGVFRFPERNEGLVTFLSTSQANLGICNTQTLHLNFTLPTWLEGGSIQAEVKERFIQEHLTWITLIQVVEPLLAAVYGTPDVFSLIDPRYSMGSQRGTRSRYIGIQTFSTKTPVNGKQLLRPRPRDPAHWYNRICSSEDAVYQPHTDVGFDVNLNKFKNHGVEIRFMDWFPEAYLQGVMDFFLLLGAHAVALVDQAPKSVTGLNNASYYGLVERCLRQGCMTQLSVADQEQITTDLCLEEGHLNMIQSPYEFLCRLKTVLWWRYRDSEVMTLMAPGGGEPQLVNYNRQAYQELRRGLYGKQVLILRAEASIFEQRTPLVPADVALLIREFDVRVESSMTRCFSDETYRAVGATVIPSGTWMEYPHALVVGLKGLRKGEVPQETQTLFHFAHGFKQQEGWREILEPLRRATFVDYEFMLDDEGKRTVSFCKQAGYVGAYLALMAYYGLVLAGDISFKGFVFAEEAMNQFLEGSIPYRERPRILLAGFGNVGQRVKAVLDRFSLECTVKRRGDPQVTAEEILSYDIYLHAIQLDMDSPPAPFLTEQDLDRERRLRLIVDMSCDLGHSANPLPIYHRYGTREEPIQRLRQSLFQPTLDLIAVPYLPSFDPVRSSVEFSNEWVWYVSEAKWLQVHPERNGMTRAMMRSLSTAKAMIAGL